MEGKGGMKSGKRLWREKGYDISGYFCSGNESDL